MKIAYQNTIKRRELVITDRHKDGAEDYCMRMVCENRIKGLLPCRAERIDDTERICYDVTSMQSLQDVLSLRPLSAQVLRALLTDLLVVTDSLEEYLLPQEGLLLVPECIFAKEDGTRFSFCYLGWERAKFQESLSQLAAQILRELDQRDGGAVILAHAFYQASIRGEMNQEALRKLLSTRQREEKKEAEPSEIFRAQLLDDFFAEEEAEEEERGEMRIRIAKRALFWILICGLAFALFYFAGVAVFAAAAAAAAGIALFFRLHGRSAGPGDPDDEAAFEDGQPSDSGADATVFLAHPAGASKQRARLEPLDEAGVLPIILAARQMRIGSSKRQADIVLPSAAVSRVHAQITCDGTRYLLKDLHSKNGSFLNETMVEEGELYPLNDGDLVRFADMRFRFLMSDT